ITPCCVSTHSQSSSWCAMISAENELGIESQPPSAGLSCCPHRFTAFSRIPLPPGYCLADCSPLSRPRPAVNAAPGGRARLWYPLAERTCPEPACRQGGPSKGPPPRLASPSLPGRYALVDQLIADGVSHVFGNPGTTEEAFMDVLQEYPRLQYVLALHESVAAGIADGYARASGRPSFLQLHINPGLGNAVGMLYNSYRTRTPMVVYEGRAPQRGGSQDPILAGDLVRMAEPVTKWAAHVEDAAELSVLLRRAFKVAMEPPRGPVFLSVPMNVMDEEAEGEGTPTASTHTRARPDPEAIERVAEVLAAAQSPVIVCGARRRPPPPSPRSTSRRSRPTLPSSTSTSTPGRSRKPGPSITASWPTRRWPSPTCCLPSRSTCPPRTRRRPSAALGRSRRWPTRSCRGWTAP